MIKTILLLAAAVALGGAVPDFSVKAPADGAEIKLADLRKAKDGKPAPVVVTFWSFKCPSGARSMDKYAALAAAAAKSGAGFVGVCAYGEPADKIAAYAKENGITYRLGMDDGYKVADVFDAEVVTATYIVDGDGKLAYKGGLDDAVKALEEVAAGKPVTKPESRTRG